MKQVGKGRDPVAWRQLSFGGLNALRGLCWNPRAEFQSEEQAEAVGLALERSENVVIILHTRGGKSIVFMALA